MNIVYSVAGDYPERIGESQRPLIILVKPIGLEQDGVGLRKIAH